MFMLADTINANSVIITLGFIGTAIFQVRSQSSKIDQDTAASLERNISAKNGEITLMKVEHDKAVALLQSSMEKMEIQIDNLKQANKVLQEALTGKANWDLITEMIKPISIFFLPGGGLEVSSKSHEKMLADLEEIKSIIKK